MKIPWLTESEQGNMLDCPQGCRAVLDCIRPPKLYQNELPISLKSQIKIFITHFHKTFSFLIKRIFLVSLFIFCQIIALHTTFHPESTLYPIYNFSVSLIRCIDKRFDTHISTGYIAMVSPHCGFWDDLSTSWKFKKSKCFVCRWHGMGSHHHRQSFCLLGLPNLTPGEFMPFPPSWILFILEPHSTLLLIHNWCGLVTETNKLSLVMLTHNTCPVKDLK